MLSLAFYANLVLIASLLGFGGGCLMSLRKNLLPWFGPLLLVSAALAVGFRRFNVTVPLEAGEWVWASPHLRAVGTGSSALRLGPSLAAAFYLLAVVAVPVPARARRAMARA